MQISDHYFIHIHTVLWRDHVPCGKSSTADISKPWILMLTLVSGKIWYNTDLCNPPSDVDELVDRHVQWTNLKHSSILDKHVPVTTRTVPQCPASVWYMYNGDILKPIKGTWKRAEREWRKTGLEVLLTVRCAKKQHVGDRLEQAAHDPCKVFFHCKLTLW